MRKILLTTTLLLFSSGASHAEETGDHEINLVVNAPEPEISLNLFGNTSGGITTTDLDFDNFNFNCGGTGGGGGAGITGHCTGGGTTLLVAILMNDMVTISHVGDSRAYFFHPDGHLEKLTSDHSLVQRLIDLKEITEQEAENHPQKNVLLKAVGQTDPFDPDIQTIRVPDGVKLMLCSDGLWGVVPEKIVQKVMAENKPLYETCQELVSAANQFGGPDNISVILVQTV